eukprot:gene14452-15950_t
MRLHNKILRLDQEHADNLRSMRSEHEHTLQSIGCFLLNTNRIHTETLACERQLKEIQIKFSSTFNDAVSNEDLTNKVIISFHKVLAAMSNLRPRLTELNQQVNKQNNDMSKIQARIHNYIMLPTACLDDYNHYFRQTQLEHWETTHSTTQPLYTSHQMILQKIKELQTLLQDPTIASNLEPFKALHNIEDLDTLAEKIDSSNNKCSLERLLNRQTYALLDKDFENAKQKATLAVRRMH